MSRKKKFIYLAFTSYRVYSVTSNNEINLNDTKQVDWLVRQCENNKPLALLPITKDNGTEELNIENMRKYLVWL